MSNYDLRDKRIAIAQAINIAKDIVLATPPKGDAVKDIAVLAERVYLELFEGTMQKLLTPPNKEEKVANEDDLLKRLAALTSQDQVMELRNTNLTLIKASKRIDEIRLAFKTKLENINK